MPFSILAAWLALAGAGCSDMPRAFRAIELGKPLHPSVFPASAHVRECTGGSNPCLLATEHRQWFLPVGLHRYDISVYRDRQGNVERVKLGDYRISYWILFLAVSDKQWDRGLDEQGVPQTRPRERPRGLLIKTPVENLPVFLIGLHQCFCEAGVAGRWKAEAERERNTPKSAGSDGGREKHSCDP